MEEFNLFGCSKKTRFATILDSQQNRLQLTFVGHCVDTIRLGCKNSLYIELWLYLIDVDDMQKPTVIYTIIKERRNWKTSAFVKSVINFFFRNYKLHYLLEYIILAFIW